MHNADLLERIKTTLDLCKPLKEQENRPSAFFIVMTGAYRRSFYTVRSIWELGHHEELGGSVFVLVRNLLEDVVSIETILAGDADHESARFFEFIRIQKYDDLRFMVSYSKEDASMLEEMKTVAKDYEAYKVHYTDKRGRVYKSWNNKLVGQMIRELKANCAPGFNAEILPLLAKIYLDGNRKSHFNPSDILPYLYEDAQKVDSKNHIDEGLITTIALFARLTYRYAVAYMTVTNDYQYDDLIRRAIADADYAGMSL